MRYLSKALILVAVCAWVVGAWPQPSTAAEVNSAELVIITEDTVIQDDLYVIGSRVLIRGVVDGDLIAIAGQDVRIEGRVTGSVMATASEVVVTGTIGGSLRVTAGGVSVDGPVGRDVFAVARRVDINAGVEVSGDVILWAWSASSLGSVGGDVTGNVKRLSLGGVVSGDVAVTVQQLEISSPLSVEGDLNYRSDNDLIGESNLSVRGATVRQEPVPANIRVRAVQLLGRLLIAIVLSAVALLVVSTWPRRTERALDALRDRPLACVAWGAGVMLSPLILAGVAVGLFAAAPPSASVPLIAIMLPLIAAALGLVLIVGIVAGIPTVAWLGTAVGRRTTLYGGVALGSGLVGLLWLLPYVGLAIAVLTVVFGAGAWIVGLRAPASTVAEQSEPLPGSASSS